MNAPGPGHNSSPAVFKGTFADFSIVKTRKLARFVVEVPIEEADAALEAMGGLPRSDMERWVAVALLNPNPDREPFKGEDLRKSRTDADQNPTASPQGGRGERSKQRWDTMSRAQQAGVLCGDPRFFGWLANIYGSRCSLAAAHGFTDDSDLSAAVVRELCGVQSRRDLDTDKVAGKRWDALVTEYRIATGQMAQEHGR